MRGGKSDVHAVIHHGDGHVRAQELPTCILEHHLDLKVAVSAGVHERREAHSIRRVHVGVENLQRLDYVSHVALTCGKMKSGAAVVVAGVDVRVPYVVDIPLIHR